MITTQSNDQWPCIEWEIGDLMEFDPEERMEVFDAFGKDKNGRSYSGSAYFFCNELDEIKDIERL